MNKTKKADATPKTKVTKSLGYDRLSATAKFPDGSMVRFSMSRAGERLTVGISNDRAVAKEQLAALTEWLKYKPGETNGPRLERFAEICASHNSGEALMLAIVAENKGTA